MTFIDTLKSFFPVIKIWDMLMVINLYVPISESPTLSTIVRQDPRLELPFSQNTPLTLEQSATLLTLHRLKDTSL